MCSFSKFKDADDTRLSLYLINKASSSSWHLFFSYVSDNAFSVDWSCPSSMQTCNWKLKSTIEHRWMINQRIAYENSSTRKTMVNKKVFIFLF